MLQFKLKTQKIKTKNIKESSNFGKQANVSRVPLPISPKLSKKVLEKLKIYKGKTNLSFISTQSGQSYTQASKSNINDIIKIKENFLNISTKKFKKIHKVLNELKLNKPKFNMTTKGPSRKQVIVLMSLTNSERFMTLLSKHLSNINRSLKDIELDAIADFI